MASTALRGWLAFYAVYICTREALGPLCEVDEKGNQHVHRTAIIGTLHRSEIKPGEGPLPITGVFLV